MRLFHWRSDPPVPIVHVLSRIFTFNLCLQFGASNVVCCLACCGIHHVSVSQCIQNGHGLNLLFYLLAFNLFNNENRVSGKKVLANRGLPNGKDLTPPPQVGMPTDASQMTADGPILSADRSSCTRSIGTLRKKRPRGHSKLLITWCIKPSKWMLNTAKLVKSHRFDRPYV